jgi:hypothetical protein
MREKLANAVYVSEITTQLQKAARRRLHAGK